MIWPRFSVFLLGSALVAIASSCRGFSLSSYIIKYLRLLVNSKCISKSKLNARLTSNARHRPANQPPRVAGLVQDQDGSGPQIRPAAAAPPAGPGRAGGAGPAWVLVPKLGRLLIGNLTETTPQPHRVLTRSGKVARELPKSPGKVANQSRQSCQSRKSLESRQSRKVA